MKIGLNATCFNDRPSGAKQRFVGMYSELFKIMSDTEFIIFEPSDCILSDWFDRLPNLTFYKTPIPSEGRLIKSLKGVFFWNKILKKEKFDLFEGFNLPMVKNRYGKTVMTIHDLRGLKDEYSLLYQQIFKAVLNLSFYNADHIITGSKEIEKDIADMFPESSLSVIYNGIDKSRFFQKTDKDILKIKNRLNLPHKFILAVGHFEKRKNYERLIKTISILENDLPEYSLVIIGNNNGELNVVEELISSLSLSEKVKIYSGLTDLEVFCAYRSCSLFIFPSLYEGFGIPILEAMSAKIPIALSDLEVFKEITESHLTYFNPLDIQSIQASIKSLLLDETARRQNIAYGQERIQAFTFKQLATQMEAIYRDQCRKNA